MIDECPFCGTLITDFWGCKNPACPGPEYTTSVSETSGSSLED